ncbi:hypothetical protein BG000_003717 [Podila horticola]|nr:hypothetical protein BG000_003717 [Podila horticola]
MLQQPRDQGSRTSTSAAYPDDHNQEGIYFSDEDYEEEYSDEDICYNDEGEDVDQEDIYGDFSVNTKAPSRTKPTNSAKGTRPRPLSNVVLPHHQLEFSGVRPIPPEVLHLIFSYADLPTLYRGISRVSRQFNAIARHYIEVEGTWTLGTQQEEDDLLEKLRSGSVNVLNVKFPSSRTRTTGRLRPYDRGNWAWPRFIGFITDPIHGNNRSSPNTDPSDAYSLSGSIAAISLVKRDPKQPCLLNRVKKMIIDDPALRDILPYLNRIHTLELNIKSKRYDLALQPILKICSSLDTLIIHGHNYAKTLKDFAMVPINPFRNSFDEQLALTAELFPHTQHLDVTLSLTEDWSADTVTSNFLAQLNSIAFIGKEACNEDMNSLLKHCRMLTRLSAPDVSYTRPPLKKPPSVDQGVRAALDAAEVNRHRSSTRQEQKYNSWRTQVPLSKVRHQKLHQRVEKRLIREEIISRRHQHLSSSWRCSRLRVLEMRIGTENQVVSAEEYEDVFRFLEHASANLEQLTLHLNTLWVGQEYQVETTKTELRTRIEHWEWPNRPQRFTYSWREYVKVLVWQKSIQAFQKLGRLSRLERLIVHVKNVPGVLCQSDFAFLRGADSKGRKQGGMTESVFCPRLQSMRICCATTVEFGKTREEPFGERQFVNALKTIRPEATVSFK